MVAKNVSSNNEQKKIVSDNKPAAKKTSTSQRKSVKDMTDDELRSFINRAEMERKYSQLTAAEVSKGRKFVNDVLQNAVKQTATKYTTKAMEAAVEAMLKKMNSHSGGGSH